MGEAMTLRVVKLRERIKQGAADFERQWGSVNPSLPCHWKEDGTTFGDMINALRALDLETCSATDVNGIIGRAWAELECDHCGKQVEVVAAFGDEPDHDARWQELCAECLALGLKEIA